MPLTVGKLNIGSPSETLLIILMYLARAKDEAIFCLFRMPTLNLECINFVALREFCNFHTQINRTCTLQSLCYNNLNVIDMRVCVFILSLAGMLLSGYLAVHMLDHLSGAEAWLSFSLLFILMVIGLIGVLFHASILKFLLRKRK